MSTTESELRSSSRTRSGRPITRPVHAGFPAPTTPPVPGIPSPELSSGEVIALRPSTRSVTYTHETVLSSDDAEALWELYVAAMGPVDEVAAMLHLEDRDVVFAAFEAPEMIKVVARAGSVPVGLGMITPRLDLIPGISPAFFENQFPDHADGRIFYVSAVLVDPNRRGKTVFSRLLNEMTYIAERVGGVMVFDTCSFNREGHRMDAVVQRIVDRFPRSSWQIIDQQTWYAAELPDPSIHRN